jgi:transcription initiation factor IIE alpha subunit
MMCGDANLQERSVEAYGYETYECPICGAFYSEYDKHDPCPEQDEYIKALDERDKRLKEANNAK